MWKWLLLFFALVFPVASQSATVQYRCTTANGETIDVFARDGNVVVDFNDKGDWQKAFGKVDGKMVSVIVIVAGGRFIMSWDTKSHAAYVITDHNNTGKRVEDHAYCSWR